MHLRSLKLRGFKSFPDTVEVKLEPGVAVVVGPNGSGKSNVSDAIVWAAGSLTPSEMRAEKPDDVLFAGGGDRAAADHCEVELVFDNTDGEFGDELDYSEISIARRLVRGGEGQYLVNKAAVRRTDIVELLADVGLGGSMHSIVSQGKVDAVLASKPEDRRALVEEAAGLGKFKRRKHRAELKLARVAIQVERALDVEAEVKKRLRPLALQATAAERAEKLAVEVSRLEARIADLDLAAIADRRIDADSRRDAAALARRGTQERLTSVLEERQGCEDELSDAAGKRETALSALYRLQSATERIAMRSESVGALETRLRTDHERAVAAVTARDDPATEALEDAARAAAAAARNAAAESGRAAERARTAHARVAAVERSEARRAEARLDEIRTERRAVEARLASAASGSHGAAASRLVGIRERLASRRETASALAASIGADHAAAVAAGRRAGSSPSELEQIADHAAAAARAAATERDDLAERARAALERVAALERSIAEREGVAPAARALAADGESLALAALDVEPGQERAVAAALGSRASALLAADGGAALALLHRARAEGLGSLTVLAGRDPNEIVRALPIVPLDDLLDVSQASVTIEGFGFDPVRGELWFAGETAEAVLLEMDARRRSLVAEADDLGARATVAAREAEEAAERARNAESSYADVAHLKRIGDPALLGRLAEVARTLERVTGRAEALAITVESPLTARIDEAARASVDLGEELSRLAQLEAGERQIAADAGARAQRAEVVVARLGGATEMLPVEPDADRERLAVEAQQLLTLAETAAATSVEAADRARTAEGAIAASTTSAPLDPDLVGRLVAAAAAVAKGLGAATELSARLETPVRARVDAGAVRSGELGSRLRELGAAEVELRQAADEAAERATAVQVELARLDADAAEATRRRETAGDVEPAEGDDRDELQTRAERLDARRLTLGQVNPLAKEEYEAEKERLDELSTQRKDLEESLAEIEKLRDELADTVQRRFDETFATVSENFTEVATTLFPGGEGRLRLVQPDEEGGEVGIEVELRPAGKKITRLSLLSGGEKALGAISFLFALFLAKPCPFYLLDEVEAALDDTNIARFVELLRRYADRAQFVVITHQKRTMEAADVLYGVTMGADGVSQIVSRRLPREHAAAATA